MQIPEVQLWVHVWVDYNYKDNFYFCNLTKQGLPKIAAQLLGNPRAQLYSINTLACQVQDALQDVCLGQCLRAWALYSATAMGFFFFYTGYHDKNKNVM